MIALIRWVLVAPLTLFAWLAVFASTLALHNVFDTNCPAAYDMSGSGTVRWSALAQDALLIVGASLSAVMVILVATFVAPAQKARVAVIVYLLGLSAAAWLFVQTDEFGAFAGAAFCGLITAWIAFRRLSRRPSLGDGYQRRLFR